MSENLKSYFSNFDFIERKLFNHFLTAGAPVCINIYIYRLSQTSNATHSSVYKIISYEIISILMLLLHITITIYPFGISGYCLKSCSTEHHRGGYKSLLFF